MNSGSAEDAAAPQPAHASETARSPAPNVVTIRLFIAGTLAVTLPPTLLMGALFPVVLAVFVMRQGGGVVAVAQTTSVAYGLYALALFSVFLHASREQPGGCGTNSTACTQYYENSIVHSHSSLHLLRSR